MISAPATGGANGKAAAVSVLIAIAQVMRIRRHIGRLEESNPRRPTDRPSKTLRRSHFRVSGPELSFQRDERQGRAGLLRWPRYLGCDPLDQREVRPRRRRG